MKNIQSVRIAVDLIARKPAVRNSGTTFEPAPPIRAMAYEQCRLRIIVYHPQRRCRPAGLKFGSDLIHRIESCFAALLCHWRKEKTRQQQIGGISVRDALRIGEATSLIADIVGTTNKREIGRASCRERVCQYG